MAVKEKIGIVVSNKMAKTSVIAVSERVTHAKYKKVIKRTKRYSIHDPESESSIGDTVKIRETKPMSKTKNWELISILRKTTTT